MPKAATAKKKEPALYDAAAQQRIPMEITEGGDIYETAHVVAGVKEERLLAYVDEVDTDLGDVKTEEEMVARRDRLAADVDTATRKLWLDHIKSIENVEEENFRELVEQSEVDAVVSAMLNVDIVPPAAATCARKLSANVVIKTRALFSGKLLVQTHTLKRRTPEFQKKYDQIFDKDDAAPQSERLLAKQAIYKQILVKADGFKGAVPVRFAVAVVDHYFQRASSISPKK